MLVIFHSIMLKIIIANMILNRCLRVRFHFKPTTPSMPICYTNFKQLLILSNIFENPFIERLTSLFSSF